MKYVIAILFACFVFTSNGNIIGSTSYMGKNYFVDVVNIKGIAKIFLRTKDNVSSIDDLYIGDIAVKSDKLGDLLKLTCRIKESYDDKKAILGCLMTVGSVFCATAVAASEGTLAFSCYATWKYTAEKGLADCIDGVSDKIAEYLGKEKEWAAVGVITKVKEKTYIEAISKSIDLMCKDIKGGN